VIQYYIKNTNTNCHGKCVRLKIKADEKINESELEELQNWCILQSEHRNGFLL
jgi:NAD-dependent DNA ligase